MFEWIDIVNNSLRRLVTTLEPGELSGDQAAVLVKKLAEVERLAAAGKALAAARVDESNRWRRDGHRSAAHWMAAQTGTSVRSASEAIDTAKRVTKLPQVDEAFRSGKLSASQAGEISAAAAVSPQSEHDLLGAAKTESLSGLRERCRRTRHAALPDEAARNEAVRLSRYFRHRTTPDGAFETSTRGLPVDGARLLAALEPFQKQVFEVARRAGTREPYEAYAYDALILMAESRAAHGSATGPKPDAGTSAVVPASPDDMQQPEAGRARSAMTSSGDRTTTSTSTSTSTSSTTSVAVVDAPSGLPRNGSHADRSATGVVGPDVTAVDEAEPDQIGTDQVGDAHRMVHAGWDDLVESDSGGVEVVGGDDFGGDHSGGDAAWPDRFGGGGFGADDAGPDGVAVSPEGAFKRRPIGPTDSPGRTDHPDSPGGTDRSGRLDRDNSVLPGKLDQVDRLPGRSDRHSPSPVVGPKAMIHVRVDLSALRRGHTVDGEICEIPGVGPVPVATARMLAADSIINVLLVDGVDVARIAHAGRTVSAHQRSALRERSSTCEVPGCDARNNLEIDHNDPWALSKNTSLENLNLLCRWHHYQKTHCGYRLTGTPGHRQWHPPRTTN